ncbi:hypothetical protein Taro_010161 [Colocasia esculenta]|uniref:Uncharacterized protein n=1 Tax=Colocasia esculenta TaxID=4460 RepID=A0A843U661_COLES|nr:hypothetical protein [Colocasia esculenta]
MRISVFDRLGATLKASTRSSKRRRVAWAMGEKPKLKIFSCYVSGKDSGELAEQTTEANPNIPVEATHRNTKQFARRNRQARWMAKSPIRVGIDRLGSESAYGDSIWGVKRRPTHDTDYLKRISMKMLTMESRTNNQMPSNPANQNPPDPGPSGWWRRLVQAELPEDTCWMWQRCLLPYEEINNDKRMKKKTWYYLRYHGAIALHYSTTGEKGLQASEEMLSRVGEEEEGSQDDLCFDIMKEQEKDRLIK